LLKLSTIFTPIAPSLHKLGGLILNLGTSNFQTRLVEFAKHSLGQRIVVWLALFSHGLEWLNVDVIWDLTINWMLLRLKLLPLWPLRIAFVENRRRRVILGQYILIFLLELINPFKKKVFVSF